MKTVLITGANKGIGLEVVKQLSENNYSVILTCRDVQRGEEALASLAAQGYKHIRFLQLDITSQTSITQAVQQLKSENITLDILINNAGISGPWPQPVLTLSLDDTRQVFETNFFGQITTTQHLIPLMENAPVPVIVNVSSSLGSSFKNADPMWNYGADKLMAYNASKTALNSFTITLAHALKSKGFKVNSVNPGYTATDLNAFQGELHPSEAAKVIVKYAILDENGPTGGFFEAEGMLPW